MEENIPLYFLLFILIELSPITDFSIFKSFNSPVKKFSCSQLSHLASETKRLCDWIGSWMMSGYTESPEILISIIFFLIYDRVSKANDVACCMLAKKSSQN